jgi:hypothetical protein
MTGHKRRNIEALCREFGIGRVSVVPADIKSGKQVAAGEIVIMSIENDP